MTLVMIQMKTLCCKKFYFILNSLAQFELLRVFQLEISYTGKHIFISKCFHGFFLLKHLLYIYVILILLKMSMLSKVRFERKCRICFQIIFLANI